ncbi:MAG: bifunctional folylpolyglutamate synthase/dihydrofolate synthase [Thermoleophilia bacterium]
MNQTGEWEGYLASLAAFGMRPGLERVSRLLDTLGRPQTRFRAVHVVGTNGKSSTTRYTAAILHAHGLRAGAYLSPHIVGFTDRILIDGRSLAAASFGRAVATVRSEVAKLPASLGETTQFEVLTVAAFVALAAAGVEVAAIEAGLGGRLDATNVLAAPVVVLTNIALEHTEVLGATRELIFAEKAAVIKGGDAIFGALDGLDGQARQVCSAAGARAHFLGRDVNVSGQPQDFTVSTPGGRYEHLSLPSPAAYQLTNAALAVMAAETLLGRLDETSVRAALATTAVPGRLQVIAREPLILADGAHNPDGMRSLLTSLAAIDWPHPRVVVLAIMRDKSFAEMIAALVPHVDAFVCTQASESRSLSAAGLAEAVAGVAGGPLARSAGESSSSVPEAGEAGTPRVELMVDAHRAVERARMLAGTVGSVLVAGSLYLLEDLSDLLTATTV